MLNQRLNRKVLFEKTIAVYTENVKRAFDRNRANQAIKSMVGYSNPELIPNGYGVFGLAVVIDTRSQITEISPEIIVEGNSDLYMRKVRQCNFDDVTRRIENVSLENIDNGIDYNNIGQMSGSVEQLVSRYNSFGTSAPITTVTNIDVRSIMSILAEMISEDLAYVKAYVEGIRGDVNRFIYESNQVNTPYGLIIKEGNRFEFPDGLIVLATNVFRKPDGSYHWNYDVALSNELMRAAKDDSSFSIDPINRGYRYNNGY